MGKNTKTAPVRVVLDTNVLIPALLIQAGRLSWIRSAWYSERILPLISNLTLMELVGVLAYSKFALKDDEQRELLDDFLPLCECVAMPSSLPAVPECRDHNDIPFLSLALVGHAEFLVTGDDDLLTLAKRFSVSILSPVEFKNILNF